MTIVFVIQISSAIYTFQFIGQSQSLARHSIERMMDSYSYGSTERMDWIQRNVRNAKN